MNARREIAVGNVEGFRKDMGNIVCIFKGVAEDEMLNLMEGKMGAWGTSLYANDSASDLRGDYLDKLRRGKSNEEVTQELIAANKDIMGDVEEEPLFWFALADTQWNYGRLLPEVKEKALYYLGQDKELERWRESGEKNLLAWMDTLEKLGRKLNSPQPPKKKVYKYRLYRCEWKIGDVFAYRFESDYSKEKGVFGRYIAFRKVSEGYWWPGHIVPVVEVYKRIWEKIPSLECVIKEKLLEQTFSPEVLKKDHNIIREYYIKLLNESKKVIPEANITYIGNKTGKELDDIPYYEYVGGYIDVGWENQKFNRKFEHYIINQYLLWKGIDSVE